MGRHPMAEMQPLLWKLINLNSELLEVKKQKYPCTGPEGSMRLRLPYFKTIGTSGWYGCQPYEPTTFIPQDIFLVLISVRGR
jgi:hypothetical protein